VKSQFLRHVCNSLKKISESITRVQIYGKSRLLVRLLCISHELSLDALVFAEARRQKVPSPHPLHWSLALVTLHIEIARRAVFLLLHARGLQPVGQDDVRIHGSDVQVINERPLHAFWLIPKLL